MSTTMPKIQTLVRAQTALMRIELRYKATQASTFALALVLGLVGLGMLNVAAFLGLSHVLAPAWSALILSGVDAVLAILLVQAAGRVRPGPEAEMAKEVRDILLTELSNDAQSVRDEFDQVRSDVQRIRSGYTSLSGGLPAGLGSIIELMTKTLARSSSKKKKKGS